MTSFFIAKRNNAHDCI